MASIWLDPRTNKYLIKFHFGGRRFTRSCQTQKEGAAKLLKASVEETIALLNKGRLVMPEDTPDPGTWIMSGGKATQKPKLPSAEKALLGDVCESYFADQRDKAETTLVGERIHIRHLKRVLGEKAPFAEVTVKTLRDYVTARLKEQARRKRPVRKPRKKSPKAKTWESRTVSGATVKKELKTFMQIWDWARKSGIVRTPCPLLDPHKPRKWAISLPKPNQSEDFMTWSEIELRVKRGGLSTYQQACLWKYVYLDEKEVAELLSHVLTAAKHPFIHPMFAMAAYTGARRSEICRAMLDDFKFDDNLIIIRERKRRKDMASSTRKVPMHPQLKQIMQKWFKEHPGGQYAIAPPLGMPRRSAKQAYDALTREEAHHHFKQTLADSKWKVVRGFHVLRHSFGAICTRVGVPMTMIAKWMGHTTDEMMQLYQHLFPQDEQQWMIKLPL